MSLKILAAAALALLATLGAAAADPVKLTDVTGRTVELAGPARRILVGEARQIQVVAALKGANAFEHVIAWRDDLLSKDADSYAAYRERFPFVETLPRFGYVGDGTFDLEAVLALKPDLLTLNLEAQKAVEDSGMEKKAAAAGLQIVYFDFRLDPERNTEPSIRLLGKIFGAEAKAEEFIAYRRAGIALVTDRLTKAKPKRPTVFIERSPGAVGEPTCCRTFGPYNFGAMVDLAGGHNIGADVIKGAFGDLNLEQLVVQNPDHVIVTGSNWAAQAGNDKFVNVGPGADIATAKVKLAGLMTRPGLPGLKAVKANRVHAVWHQFYGTPFEFVAIQQFAKWFHPDLFADLDPDANFRAFHEKFMPVAYRPGYFASLGDGK